MAYSTGNTLGVRLAATSTTQEHELGTRVPATDGGTLVYVQANGAITVYDAVGIDENFQAAPLTAAMAGDGWYVGFAQVAFADNEYGWVYLTGSNISLNVASGCNADVPLYTTTVPGTLDDATTGTNIDGVVAVTAKVTSAAFVEVIATWPRSTTF